MAQKPDYSRAHFLAVAAKYRAIAREKPSDGSENCEMLLTHLNSKSAFAATLEGVSFGMKDGKRTVRCLVTYKALTDMVGVLLTKMSLMGLSATIVATSKMSPVPSSMMGKSRPTEVSGSTREISIPSFSQGYLRTN